MFNLLFISANLSAANSNFALSRTQYLFPLTVDIMHRKLKESEFV